MFERVVRIALVRYLEENKLVPDGQHGFRSMRSTLTQLLSYWDTILGELEQGHDVDVIYTDFSKAFDKEDTGVLLHKLREGKGSRRIVTTFGMGRIVFLDFHSLGRAGCDLSKGNFF